MVDVRLAREWTDGAGAAHAAGDTVYVDAATLAELEADGVVASTGTHDGLAKQPQAQPDWAGMTGTEV